MTDIRFILDEDGDIVDNEKIKIYNKDLEDDWNHLLVLLNTLEYQKRNAIQDYDGIVEILLEEFEEYNKYIDEYSMIKTDILMDLLSKCGVDYEQVD